jgi:hypothetical protein
MTDFSYLSDQLASQQIAERVATAERTRVNGRGRRHGRHALADRLHKMADRLDG